VVDDHHVAALLQGVRHHEGGSGELALVGIAIADHDIGVLDHRGLVDLVRQLRRDAVLGHKVAGEESGHFPTIGSARNRS